MTETVSDAALSTPFTDLVAQARKHYEELSGKAMYWSSSIPHAIDAWEREPALLAELVSLRAQLAAAEAKYESAEFWKDWVYPEGATAQQVQDELYDYRVVLESVSEVYSHITHSRISKPNTRAREVIAVSDDLEREAIEEETKDLQEQLDEAEAEREAMREALTKIDNPRNATQIKVRDDPLDMTPEEYIDADGFASMPVATKKAFITVANMAREALARRGTVSEAGEEG